MKKILLILILFFLQNSFAQSANQPKSGYKGTLPNVERYFEYKQDASKYNPRNPMKEQIPDPNMLLKAPTEDSLFLDVIIKKEKYSPYIKDVLGITGLFEKFRISLLEEKNDIQKFNAQINVIDLHVTNLVKKYNSGSYALSDSYVWCQRIAYSSKLFGNLLYDANYYSRYMPVADGRYSSKNIQKEKENLIQELEKAIFSLKQLE